MRCPVKNQGKRVITESPTAGIVFYCYDAIVKASGFYVLHPKMDIGMKKDEFSLLPCFR
jgi:hypothetical protein